MTRDQTRRRCDMISALGFAHFRKLIVGVFNVIQWSAVKVTLSGIAKIVNLSDFQCNRCHCNRRPLYHEHDIGCTDDRLSKMCRTKGSKHDVTCDVTYIYYQPMAICNDVTHVAGNNQR